jgi:hypothetical protein
VWQAADALGDDSLHPFWQGIPIQLRCLDPSPTVIMQQIAPFLHATQ